MKSIWSERLSINSYSSSRSAPIEIFCAILLPWLLGLTSVAVFIHWSNFLYFLLVTDPGYTLLNRGGFGDREWLEQAYRQSLGMFTEMGAPGYIRVHEERLGGMYFDSPVETLVKEYL